MRRVVTNPVSSCSQCTCASIPQGGEAESLSPLLLRLAAALRPKCDTSSLRWECMSSVQQNTLAADKDVSAFKHK